MIYIYNDFGGTHTTALAAAYHLKKLDESREPTEYEILHSHNFNKLTSKDRGKLFFHGTDDEGNNRYGFPGKDIRRAVLSRFRSRSGNEAGEGGRQGAFR